MSVQYKLIMSDNTCTLLTEQFTLKLFKIFFKSLVGFNFFYLSDQSV